MKRLRLISTLTAFLLLAVPTSANAGWVEGYWKNDGTYVNGYWRSDPNGLKYDNYSFDGDWSDAYNDSYFSPTKNYSSNWYTASWVTQDDYWVGKSFYDSRSSYSTFKPTTTNYSYKFWNDPIYDYTPSYNYGYSNSDLFTSNRYHTYTPSLYNSYSNSLLNNNLYNSSYSSPYSNYTNTFRSNYTNPYNTYNNYGSSLYNSGSYYNSNSYLNNYSSDNCYSLYCY